MAEDLNIPVEIVPCPTQRETDGLALSSRNVYLSPDERKQAIVLSKSLTEAAGWIQNGITVSQLITRLKEEIRKQPLANIDYVDVLTYPDLKSLNGQFQLQEAEVPLLIALAVRFGKTRLIDNKLLDPAEVGADLCFAK
jgi:pantoate--beta-alanine ligase